MHPTIGHDGAVWYGGTGHRILSTDAGIECYRCGMAAEDGAREDLIPDCIGPDGGLDHHWMADGRDGIECAHGDYRIRPFAGSAAGSTHCTRA